MANISKMNKAQLIEHGKTLGIELDNSMPKKSMLDLIKQANKKPAKLKEKKKPAKLKEKKKPAKLKEKKKPATIVGQPKNSCFPPVKQTQFKSTPNVESKPEKSIWQTIKDFFGGIV